MQKRDKMSLRDLGKALYGEPARDLPKKQLPLYKDVGLQLLQLEKLQSLSRSEAVAKTAEEIKRIFNTASIPTISLKSIRTKIMKLLIMKRAHEQAEVLDKRTGKLRDQGKFRKKKGNNKIPMKLSDVINKLFDVSSGVPELEKEFYVDQCTDRKMYIGDVDKVETTRLRKVAEKLQKREEKELLKNTPNLRR